MQARTVKYSDVPTELTYGPWVEANAEKFATMTGRNSHVFWNRFYRDMKAGLGCTIPYADRQVRDIAQLIKNAQQLNNP